MLGFVAMYVGLLVQVQLNANIAEIGTGRNE
jgi:hypothetical protein